MHVYHVQVYTGYGESPSQGKIANRGSAYTLAEYPQMDYITGCHVSGSGLSWQMQAQVEGV